ncbi:MAG: hypothetical protein JRI23_13255 [Deltaproteobacteria bacterium]|nr:hypothetical protein [Deltaproteobacteria bacterium]MBW2532691.1 hypothetical protein [Deltaproteobacteria bacterium]
MPPASAVASSPRLDSDVGHALVELAPEGTGKNGRFLGRSAAGRRLEVTLAIRARPRPHRADLAAYRVAQALGLAVVPPTRVERLPVARLGALLANQEEVRALVAERAVVDNDGTVLALMQQSCPGRPLFVGTGAPASQWADLASAADAPPPEVRRTLSGYVQMVVLDFLIGNVERSNVAYDESAGALCVADNSGGFPGYLGPAAQDLLLRRLRPLRRFPAGLDEALRRLDEAKLRSLLQRGAFTDWLVGPRQLTDFAERRAALRTLLAAKIAQHGRASVLSL